MSNTNARLGVATSNQPPFGGARLSTGPEAAARRGRRVRTVVGLVCTDLDGTLLDSSGVIRERTLSTLAEAGRWRRRGGGDRTARPGHPGPGAALRAHRARGVQQRRRDRRRRVGAVAGLPGVRLRRRGGDPARGAGRGARDRGGCRFRVRAPAGGRLRAAGAEQLVAPAPGGHVRTGGRRSRDQDSRRSPDAARGRTGRRARHGRR